MTDYFNKKEISQRAEDELLYEYVMEEMEQEPSLIKGLWAKAMAHSEGNDDKAKSLYMQYRVQSIKRLLLKQSITNPFQSLYLRVLNQG